MTLETIIGDLFEADTRFIAHQCNCITQKAAHLSAAMFERFPYANCYKGRTTPDQPGTIQIRGNGADQRFVINCFGQGWPGKPKYPDSVQDGFEARKRYFHSCLKEIAKIPAPQSIGFPHGIGCGAAGGDWTWYEKQLEKFAAFVGETGARVVIYKLEDK
mgnify:CR=1 FL=1